MFRIDIKIKLYVTKILVNDLVVIGKSKTTLTLIIIKSAYAGMYILDLRKELIYEFHYDNIKKKYGNDYYSLTLIVWCMKLKLKMFMKTLIKTKKCLIFVIIQLS